MPNLGITANNLFAPSNQKKSIIAFVILHSKDHLNVRVTTNVMKEYGNTSCILNKISKCKVVKEINILNPK